MQSSRKSLAKQETKATRKAPATVHPNTHHGTRKATTKPETAAMAYDVRTPDFFIHMLELAAQQLAENPALVPGVQRLFTRASNGKILLITKEELAAIKMGASIDGKPAKTKAK